ncbi:MAG: PAS domain S-box protein, partial [Halochromatium sp.]
MKHRQTAIGRFAPLALLGLLASIGNGFGLAVFFGVDFLFGSIAALLALFWFGPRAGLLVAAIGASTTWLLFAQPYTALVLLAELTFICWHRHRAARGQRRIPMLASSDALYWLLLGIPLGLVVYHVALGSDGTSTWLMVLTHAINGILNATLAGLIILTVALFRERQRTLISFRRILFNVLLMALLLPALLLAIWQNLGLKHQLETDAVERAKLTGVAVVNQLAAEVDPATADPLALETALDALSQRLGEQIAAGGPGMSFTLEPWSAWRAEAGRARQATSAEGLWVTLPAQPVQSQILELARWHAADYRVRLPKALSPIADQALIVNFGAAPLIDELQQQTLRHLLVLAGIALFGIAIATWLSSRLTRPLQQLAQATQRLPTAIADAQPLPRLTRNAIRETDELASTVTEMAHSLRFSFDLLASKKQRQDQLQALATLQARLLSRLIERDEDEAAFADDLHAELARLLPRHRCLLIQQGPSGEYKPLGTASAAAGTPARDGPALLDQAAVIACCDHALTTATPCSLPEATAAGLLFPIVGHATLLVAIEQPTAPPDAQAATQPTASDAGFTREILEVASNLAGVALEALQLRRRHQVLIEALSQAQTGVIITEHLHGEDLIIYVNSGFETMTGYSAAEVLGRDCRFLQGEDRAQEARWRMRAAIHAGETCNVIMRNYRKDGSRFWNSLHLSAMRDREGQVTHYIGVQQDISEAIETLEQLRQTEASLREQEARYRLMVENVEDLIVRVDMEGRFEFVSPSYCKTFGRREDELLGKSFTPSVHPDDRAAVTAARASLHAPPHRCSLEQREHTAQGWRWLQWSNTAIRDDSGAVIGIIGVGRDITERKQAEVELAKREAMVSELLRLATGFVGVADDVNDPSIEQALARVGDFINADRSYLLCLSADGGKVDQVIEHTAEDVTPIGAYYRDLPIAKLPMMMAPLAVGEPVVIADVAEFGASAWVEERRLLETQQLQSLLLAPLRLDGRLFGVVGVETVRAHRPWSTVEVQFLQLFANILVASEQRTRSLAALKQSNAHYDALARQSRTITWELDAEGRFSFISEVCEAVLGYAPSEMLGRHFSDYIAEPEAGEQAAKATDLMARRQPLEEFIMPFRSRAGVALWLASDGRPILADNGESLGYRGITKDVTERQLALQRLAHSESRLSAIFENTPIGIALIGQDRRPLMVNQALTRFLGRKAEILTQVRLDDVTHPNDLHTVLGGLDDLFCGRRDAYRISSRYLHAERQVLWGDLRLSLLPTRADEAPIALAMIENITDLHQARERQRAAEQELTDYAEQLESLLDLVNLSASHREQVQALLRLARRSLRLDSAAVWRLDADTNAHLLSAVPDDRRPSPAPPALIAEALAELGNPIILAGSESAGRASAAGIHASASPSPQAHASMVGVVMDCTTPDGDQEHLLLTLGNARAIPPLELGQRQLLRLIAQRIAAVRHKHQLQENLVQSRERETIGHLASGVAHDFNNLLGVIDANLFFIADGLDEQIDADPELGQILAETRSALGQAKVITSGMLTISGAGKIPLEPIDLACTVGELGQILEQVLPPRIELQLDIAAGVQVFSNRAFLQSALLNLALNARDAMREQGTLTIAARPVPMGTDSLGPPRVGIIPAADAVEIRVIDTGQGIAPELLGRIFEPLFSTKAKQRGHGLGLFMVREFVARTQAGLWIDSTPGQGTCIRLLLPAQEAPETASKTSTLVPTPSPSARPLQTQPSAAASETQPAPTAQPAPAARPASVEPAARRVLLVE